MPLDPEVAAYLESVRDAPPRSSLTVEQTRTTYRAMARLAGTAEVESVRDLRIGGVPVREYTGGGGPSVVYFHGGRFFSGDLDSHDGVCRQLAAGARCRIIAVAYRLAPEHPCPAAVEDAFAVVEAARPDAVAGDSAGANLAALAALEFRSQVRRQLLVYPMLDAECATASHREFATGYGPGSEDMRRGWTLYAPERRDGNVSPQFRDDVRGAPKALVITAEYDTLRDEAEQYAERLLAAGTEVTLTRYPGAIHGFFQMGAVLRLGREAMREACVFLSEAGERGRTR